MFAVIQSGGKQYKIRPGSVVLVEKLPHETGSEVVLKDVLMLSVDAKTDIGTPILNSVEVIAAVEDQIKDKKVIIFKKKRRQNYRRKRGHRQLKTVLRILDIKKDGKSVASEAAQSVSVAPKKESQAVEEKKVSAAPKKAAVKSDAKPAETTVKKAPKAQKKPVSENDKASATETKTPKE